MKKPLPRIFTLSFMILLMGAFLFMPVTSQPIGWSGNDDLAFLLEVDGVSAADSDAANPIPVNLSLPISIELSIDVGADMNITGGQFVMLYMSFPIFTQPIPINTPALAGMSGNLLNTSIDPASLIGPGVDLISGTIEGLFSLSYILASAPTENVTVSDNFVLRIGAQGASAFVSVPGLITIGLAVMSIFSLLLSLDEFQKGIFAAHKMRSGKTPKGVGIFPAAVVLRRKPKKKEKVSKDELISRVGSAVADAESVAKYAPKAMNVVKPKSKVIVGKFSKALRLKHKEGGLLAAAMTQLGIFQTKSVKTPLKKVAFSGMTLTGMYWSIMQLMGGAVPDLLTVVFSIIAALVISVVIGYFMGWLARVPEMGYDK
ncbi:MAG: hypothetical protein KAQ65_10610 [Candidatus Thorarchaeota archaeon]|nr:hypothetical protein [Candidatus Thorarchaeota archaeon]